MQRRPVPVPSAASTQGHILVYTRVYNKAVGITTLDELTCDNVEATPFPAGVHPAYVSASCGVTRKLGDFESLRLDVSVTMPVLPDQVEDATVNMQALAYKLLSDEQSRCGIEIEG